MLRWDELGVVRKAALDQLRGQADAVHLKEYLAFGLVDGEDDWILRLPDEPVDLLQGTGRNDDGYLLLNLAGQGRLVH